MNSVLQFLMCSLQACLSLTKRWASSNGRSGQRRKAGWIELRLWIPGCQEESGMLDFSTDEEEASRNQTCDDHLSVHHP